MVVEGWSGQESEQRGETRSWRSEPLVIPSPPLLVRCLASHRIASQEPGRLPNVICELSSLMPQGTYGALHIAA